LGVWGAVASLIGLVIALGTMPWLQSRNGPEHLPRLTDSAQNKSQEQAPTTFGSPKVAPIRETSAREVIAHLNSLPPLQRPEIESTSYVGRYITWRGRVQGIDQFDTGFSLALLETGGETPWTFVRFDTQWRTRLDVLRTGDVVNVQGTILKFDGGAVVIHGTALSLVRKSGKRRAATGPAESR